MYLLLGGLDDVVKKAGDGEGADATGSGSNSSEIGSAVKFRSEVAFDYAFFAGSASIDKSGAGGDKIVRNQPRDARGAYDYIKILKFCQVIATVE